MVSFDAPRPSNPALKKDVGGSVRQVMLLMNMDEKNVTI